MKNSTVIPCPRCEFTVKNGVALWSCSGGYHPERLSWIDLAFLSALLALPILVLIAEKRRVLAAT